MSTSQHAGSPACAYLAVDGGGTKTHAVIVDEAGRRLAEATGAGCNQRTEGMAAALWHLHAAVDAASRQAWRPAPFTGAWCGLAGVDRPEDAAAMRAHLAPLAAEVRVTNDAELVLAGLDGRPGVALISGTGSIALGTDAAGNTVRVGGWGHFLGDEGSGYDIGRRALQLVLRMADGRTARRALLDVVLQHFDVEIPGDLIECVYTPSAKRVIAALAPVVLEAARSGDADAQAIVRLAARELAALAIAAARQLELVDGSPGLVLSGGLLVADAWYRQAVVRRVRQRVRVEMVAVVAEPAETAAAALARAARSDATAAVASASSNSRSWSPSAAGGRKRTHGTAR